MQDNYLPLIPTGTVITATGTGTALDLMTGSNVAKNNTPGTNLLGRGGDSMALEVLFNTTNVGGTTPQAVFTVAQSDDNSDYSSVLGTTTVTANGQSTVPFRPTKRYVRASWVVTGTSPTLTVNAYVGNRPY